MKTVYLTADGKQDDDIGGGLCGFVSWRRLQEVFHSSNELRPNERVKYWRISDDGITYGIEKK